MKTIVISAVNLVEGGTLTILRDCLRYLSTLAEQGEYRIVALVFKRELADFPNIEYIETQWPKKRWLNRLWFEYVSMNNIAKKLGDVYLWFSLHDTTPNVVATRRAVYCHNPFPFYSFKWREWFMTPKIVLFSLFSKYAYQVNIHKNDYVVVQQQWIKDAFKTLFGLDTKKIIVALPDPPLAIEINTKRMQDDVFRFIYAASPNSHKNFECLTAAAAILSARCNREFEVCITVNGKENAYAEWLKKNWGHVRSIRFAGFMNRDTLFQCYANADALVFPSKVETWGLPITEFAAFGKPMLLADLPYAYETASGCDQVAFFPADNPAELANRMEDLILGNTSMLKKVPEKNLEEPISTSWETLFNHLLKS